MPEPVRSRARPATSPSTRSPEPVVTSVSPSTAATSTSPEPVRTAAQPARPVTTTSPAPVRAASREPAGAVTGDHERHHSQRQVLRRAHDQPPPGLRPGDLGGPHGLRGEVGGLGARPGRRLADPAEHTADALAPHAARARVVAHLDLHLRLVGPVEVHLDAPDVDRQLQLGDAAHRPALPAHELVVDPGVGPPVGSSLVKSIGSLIPAPTPSRACRPCRPDHPARRGGRTCRAGGPRARPARPAPPRS